MLQKNGNKRLSVSELLMHEFMTKDFSEVVQKNSVLNTLIKSNKYKSIFKLESDKNNIFPGHPTSKFGMQTEYYF